MLVLDRHMCSEMNILTYGMTTVEQIWRVKSTKIYSICIANINIPTHGFHKPLMIINRLLINFLNAMTNEKYGIEILQIFEALDMSISVPAQMH